MWYVWFNWFKWLSQLTRIPPPWRICLPWRCGWQPGATLPSCHPGRIPTHLGWTGSCWPQRSSASCPDPGSSLPPSSPCETKVMLLKMEGESSSSMHGTEKRTILVPVLETPTCSSSSLSPWGFFHSQHHNMPPSGRCPSAGLCCRLSCGDKSQSWGRKKRFNRGLKKSVKSLSRRWSWTNK